MVFAKQFDNMIEKPLQYIYPPISMLITHPKEITKIKTR